MAENLSWSEESEMVPEEGMKMRSAHDRMKRNAFTAPTCSAAAVLTDDQTDQNP